MSVSREQTQALLDQQSQGALQHTPEQRYTVADRFEAFATDKPNKTFLIDGELHISFAELNQQANRFAGIALAQGLQPGDVAAVMMENRVEFFYAWLGLAKVGVIAALINTQARDKALHHALTETQSKLLFLGTECQTLFDTIECPDSLSTLVVPEHGDDSPASRDFHQLLSESNATNPSSDLRQNLCGETPLFYVFTSGTTGLPKAAIISHMRWLGVGEGWCQLLNISEDDVFYCFLPLFHGAAGMSLVSNALAAGASIVLRRKFSASRFWTDVRKHNITTTQYIGEICRYLVNRPAQADDKKHSLKRMTGAGISASVWQQFIERFGDVHIYEGWGSTEANCGMVNVDRKPGSCGRIPFKEKSNARLVRYDLENNCHMRDENGHLIECQAGEVGELLGMIVNIPGIGAGRFEGYTNPEATEKKQLRNVFAKGDCWFSSGDLFTRDEDDYYYFVDRIGDTFRWKSENVSTTEVTEALANYEDAELINVYGVQVPEHEGRAGMAAILLKPNCQFSPEQFFAIAEKGLASYALPQFIRIATMADLTATFKLRKVDLQKQGYNPDLFDDDLYVISPDQQSYIPYSDAALKAINLPAFSS